MIQLQNEHLTWTDLTFGTEDAETWLENPDHLSQFVRGLLQSSHSRPRVTEHDDGTHVVLRGINLNAGEDAENMISLKMWVTDNAIITCHGQPMQTINTIAAEWCDKRPTSSLNFIFKVVTLLNDRITDAVDDIEAELDALDENTKANALEVAEATVNVRRKIAHFRRFLAPQRDALHQLFELANDHHASKARHFREEAERITRLIEDLDLAKDEASLIREQAMANIAQEQNSRIYIFSVLSVIFMPLTFITGLLGMNVGGMPGEKSAEAFAIVCGVSLIYMVTLIIYFKRKRWL